MGLMSGAMTTRRFRVVGTLPEGWRTTFRDRLNEFAFKEPATRMGKEELEGWVRVQNLLDTEFDDLNTWLFNQFAVFSLRVDKKSLPAKLFKATAEKRVEAWCEERGVERCPGSVKKEIKEKLEIEWLDKMLPRVATTEIVWNIDQGYLLVDSLSDSVADRVRKRFYRTFGLELQPWSPLDWLGKGEQAETLMNAEPSLVGGEK